MSELMIKVDSLSKRYRIGAREAGYKTIRETIMGGITAPFRNLRNLRNLTTFKDDTAEDVIWALKDVSFEVKNGEVLGFIGRNGAGKTTLLKVLSRITEPSTGYAEIYGRVSSLLEVGTGFHPELTGRENIFLNSAILGMRKKEIMSKFDDIVAFSEVEKYIDTPVKRYSSGMQVRLAFAVAAHLEPEILIVDEVLAVGDAAFQKKCLGKMGDFAHGGRTVLFVSHNMSAIRSLCHRTIWLDNGQIVKDGATNEVVREYEEKQLKYYDKASSHTVERSHEDIMGKEFYFRRVEISNTQGKHATIFEYNEKLILNVELAGHPPSNNYNLEFRIYNHSGQFVSMGSSVFHDLPLDTNKKRVRIEIGPLILTDGKYSISLIAVNSMQNVVYDLWEKCCSFDMVGCKPFGYGHYMPTSRDAVCIFQQTFSEEE